MAIKNTDIREAIAENKVRYWQVADMLGMRWETFSRKLRYELSPEEKKRVMQAIRKVAKEQEEG